MGKEKKIVEKYATFIGEKDSTGNPSIHLQRIFDKQEYAEEHLKHLDYFEDLFKVKFIAKILCLENLD